MAGHCCYDGNGREGVDVGRFDRISRLRMMNNGEWKLKSGGDGPENWNLNFKISLLMNWCVIFQQRKCLTLKICSSIIFLKQPNSSGWEFSERKRINWIFIYDFKWNNKPESPFNILIVHSSCEIATRIKATRPRI